MNKIVIGLIVIVLGVLAGWYFLGSSQTQTSQESDSSVQEVPTTNGIDETEVFGEDEQFMGENVIVTYSDSGFTPNSVTVKAGTTVSFVNESTKKMWVASAMHPTHQLLPGFDELESVGEGGTYEYTFAKTGTWKYHNHVGPSDTGTVTVTE